MSNAGIVTTAYISNNVDDGLIVIDSFISYHLSIGFKHIYIFWDDINIDINSDTYNYLIKLQKYYTMKCITIIFRNEQLLTLYQKYCSKYNELLQYMDQEVQARQTLNAELALRLSEMVNRNNSIELGIGLYDNELNWLLHIDIDEIFYINDDNIDNHFNYLDSMGIHSMTYMNHEGVPEIYDTNDYFLSTTLFRRHHFSLPITSNIDSALSYWKNRTQYSQYFLVYDNGKSVVKLNVNAIPKDVHRWYSNNSDFNRKTAIADPRNLCVNELLILNNGPFILHYVTCGFRWLTDKYKILGNFPDYWFGGLLQIAPSFHLKSRDVINKSDMAKEYYKKEIMFSLETFNGDNELYEEEHRRQLDNQILMRITKVSEIIKKDREMRCLQLGIQINDNSIKDNSMNDNPIKDIAMNDIAMNDNPIKDVNTNIQTNEISEQINNNSTNKPVDNNGNIAEMDKLRILSQVSQMWF